MVTWPPRQPALTNDAIEHGTPRRAWLGGDPIELVVLLVLLGGVTELCLLALWYRFQLTAWYPWPGVSLGFPQMMSGVPGADVKWYGFVNGAPFLAFVPALFSAHRLRGPLARGIILGFTVLFGATLVPMYPIAAADLFHYAADARTLVVYHQNPLLVAPLAHPFFIGISWIQQPSPYGPFWQVLTIVPTWLAGNSAVGSVIALKLLAFGCYLAAAAFVYLTVRRLFPGRELLATLTFAWNPFVIFRAVGNGHNDIAMMAFALAAFYYLSRRAWLPALPLLALSVCIKYATLIIVPPVLLYVWLEAGREQRRQVAAGLGIAIAVTAAVFVPFWQGLDTFKTFVQNTNLTITAVPDLLAQQIQLFQPDLSQTTANAVAKSAGYAVFGPVYLLLLWTVWQRRTFAALIAVCVLAFAAYLSLCTWWFRPWYLLWLLPLATLLPTPYWIGLVTVTSFGATFFDVLERPEYANLWPWLGFDRFRAEAAPVFSAFGPLLLALAFGGVLLALRQRSRRTTRPALRPLPEP